jgi:hypothetical protein
MVEELLHQLTTYGEKLSKEEADEFKLLVYEKFNSKDKFSYYSLVDILLNSFQVYK